MRDEFFRRGLRLHSGLCRPFWRQAHQERQRRQAHHRNAQQRREEDVEVQLPRLDLADRLERSARGVEECGDSGRVLHLTRHDERELVQQALGVLHDADDRALDMNVVWKMYRAAYPETVEQRLLIVQ